MVYLSLTYKRDAGSKQQNSDQQILKLLYNQLPDGLSCKEQNISLVFAIFFNLSWSIYWSIEINYNIFWWYTDWLCGYKVKNVTLLAK